MGNTVTLHRNLPKWLADCWRDPTEFNSTIAPEPNGGVLSVRGEFRTEDAAGYTLSEALDRFIAFLNFWQNSPSGFTYPESSRAVFRLGPTFNLFDQAAGRHTNSFWTNPDFDGGTWHHGTDKDKRFETSLERLRSTQRRRSPNPLFDTAIRCMVLLNGGWTAREDKHWLILVWSCFEKIFSSGVDGTKGGYAAIARRASKFDADSSIREAVLYALARHRNDAAHENDRSGSAYIAREVVTDCSRFLLWLIRWMLSDGRRFSSRSEFLDWVDIPKERERLLQRHRLHKMALTYWHPRRKKEAQESRRSPPSISVIERLRSDAG
jgi:hypothetical protein